MLLNLFDNQLDYYTPSQNKYVWEIQNTWPLHGDLRTQKRYEAVSINKKLPNLVIYIHGSFHQMNIIKNTIF